ncbi:phosphotransferase family protein [Pseudomonas umsongensis]|uniref:phosphotransferase family protein n=1 Tax=Pseudomonas umsongensis TaxID=198618 RepID=UPI00200A3C30|nr:phosphotransferase [Pseudomonas umsongensis]MCK8683279.1 aminoglycoside phosphotransferase family protein [Pseudomonas umsongensis]
MPSSQPLIPTRLDQVDATWLSHVLSLRHPGVQVTHVQVSDFLGYKPNKARLHLRYNTVGEHAGLPASMIVKGGFKRTPSGEELSGLDIGLELELQAYQELVPHLNARTPDCFYVHFDPRQYDGVMLIEDLDPSGATFLKHRNCLALHEAEAFIDAMAQLHAPWLDGVAFAEGTQFGPQSPLNERTERLQREYLDQMVHPQRWDALMALPRGAALPRQLQDPQRLAAALQCMKALHRNCAQTLVHGDEHLGNLYFDAQGNAGFIDWCARRQPWVVGFTYFLLSCLDALDRRAWERPLLQRYLVGLEACGAQAPSFDEAWLLHRSTCVFPLLTWVNNSAKWQPESINTRNALRAAWAVVDHDTLNLLGV